MRVFENIELPCEDCLFGTTSIKPVQAKVWKIFKPAQAKAWKIFIMKYQRNAQVWPRALLEKEKQKNRSFSMKMKSHES